MAVAWWLHWASRWRHPDNRRHDSLIDLKKTDMIRPNTCQGFQMTFREPYNTGLSGEHNRYRVSPPEGFPKYCALSNLSTSRWRACPVRRGAHSWQDTGAAKVQRGNLKPCKGTTAIVTASRSQRHSACLSTRMSHGQPALGLRS